MHQPGNSEIFESSLATLWFNEQGILCAIAKNVVRTLQMQKENYALIKQITGNKKVCLLSEATLASQPSAEIRNYMEMEMPKLFKAMAIVSKSAVGEMIPKSFQALNGSVIPMKYFSEVSEAKNWLQHYL